MLNFYITIFGEECPSCYSYNIENKSEFIVLDAWDWDKQVEIIVYCLNCNLQFTKYYKLEEI